MVKYSTFRLPNKLILDKTLTFSARRLGAVLYGHQNRLGCCRKSLAALARLSGLSITTVRKAVAELSDSGYIAHIRTYRYDETYGRMVYAAGVYQCLLQTGTDYTLIPRRIFAPSMSNSAFVMALYLYYQAGNSSRCFPSLATICRGIGVSIATVCRAKRLLDEIRLFYCLRCKMRNKAYSSNTYHVLQMASVTNACPTDPRDLPALRTAPFPFRIKSIIKSVVLQALFYLKGTLKISKL